jgi:ATP-binding cassette subfamily C protein CydCD
VGLLGLGRTRFALAVVLGAVAVVAGSALVGLSGYLICRAARQPPILSLTVLTVTVRAVALARPTARYGELLAAHDVAFRALGNLRGRVFVALERVAPAGLEQYRDGDLVARMVGDIDELRDLALRVLLPIGVALLAGAAIVAGTAAAFPQAGLILGGGLLCAAVVPPAAAARLTARSRRRQAGLRARLTADLVDALAAAEELWIAGADGRTAATIARDDRALVAASLRDADGAGAAAALGLALAGLTTAGVLAAAVAGAARGALSPLLVTPLTLVTLTAFEAVLPLSTAARHLPSLLAAGRRVLELVDRAPAVTDPPVSDRAPVEGTGIAVRALVVDRVGAGQAPERDGSAAQGPAPGGSSPPGVAVRVLDGVDLDLGPGDRIVVTGPSGVGKTTLAQVLVRFLDRAGGDARLGPHDLRRIDQADVRAAVLLSDQQPYVFDSTIRENVALARPGASDAEIRVALGHAQLGAWVDGLPAGLGTSVGERGCTLSGGQRQRLALARALLADPRVLLLDEPTAHLDGETAAALLDDLWRTVGDRSVVLVAHGPTGPFDGSRRLALERPPRSRRREPGHGVDEVRAASSFSGGTPSPSPQSPSPQSMSAASVRSISAGERLPLK